MELSLTVSTCRDICNMSFKNEKLGSCLVMSFSVISCSCLFVSYPFMSCLLNVLSVNLLCFIETKCNIRIISICQQFWQFLHLFHKPICAIKLLFQSYNVHYMTTCHWINFERSEILVKLVPRLNSLVTVPEIKFPGLSCLVL